MLSFLVNDHKPICEGVPASRPVGGASTSMNGEMSEWVSSILDSIFKAEETDKVFSSEELLAEVDEASQRTREEAPGEKVFMAQLDAKAFSPSLDIKHSAKLVGERVENCEVKFKEVDYTLAAMYIALNTDLPSLIREDLQAIVPKKRATRGPDPTVRTVSDAAETRGKWYKPPEKYSEEDKRGLLAKVQDIMVETTLCEHFYNWERKRLQVG